MHRGTSKNLLVLGLWLAADPVEVPSVEAVAARNKAAILEALEATHSMAVVREEHNKVAGVSVKHNTVVVLVVLVAVAAKEDSEDLEETREDSEGLAATTGMSEAAEADKVDRLAAHWRAAATSVSRQHPADPAAKQEHKAAPLANRILAAMNHPGPMADFHLVSARMARHSSTELPRRAEPRVEKEERSRGSAAAGDRRLA